jgi:transposase
LQEDLGRSRKLSSRQESAITRFVTSGKLVTAVDARNYLENADLAIVSSCTVRRVLHRSGLKAQIRRKKPLLTPRHRRLRLDFAKKYKSWNMDDWKRVIWSDETKMNLFGFDGRQYCWKKPGGPSRDHHFAPTVKHGGGAIFLWGCMTWRGIGYLSKIDNGLDAALYTTILGGELMSTLNWYGLEKADVVFQHDNDPKHTAKKTQEWLSRSGFSVLDWPPQSPDLNPIEHLWGELKRRVRKRRKLPSSLPELWDVVQEEWELIPTDFCQKLISSMPSRVEDVIRAKGSHTRW